MSNPENTPQNQTPDASGKVSPPSTPQFDLGSVPKPSQTDPRYAPAQPTVVPRPQEVSPAQSLNPAEEQGGDHGFGTIPLDILNNSSRRAATPTYEAPPPVNLPPGARLSLTGEIIEVDTPTSPSAGHMGQSASVQPPMGRPQPLPTGAPQPPLRPTQNVIRPQPQAVESKGAGGVIGIVAGLVLLVALGVGGWYWYGHRTNPKDQAKLVYTAALKQDWKTAYPLCAFSPEGKKTFPNAEAFETVSKEGYDKLAENPVFAQVIQQLKSAADTATVGDPVMNGDQSDVPTSLKMNVLGQSLTLKGTAHMVNDGGIWKLNVTGTTAQELAKVSEDLVGRP